MSILSDVNLHELDRELQETISALAEIDRWYESERNLLLTLPEPARAGLREDLERRQRQSREPYVRRLAEVYHMIMSTKLFRTQNSLPAWESVRST
ncbi:hypothetical protein ILT44_25655 [Microvirga sp. BT689]|uniref:hypothetical protein n=1 Tax=Microvirga arvi TaxID=2778731 RepID=UPI00194FA720|nr:hypothetical protein [Microvirga arvi]MBM6583589.1 hypothetical protein [Microvirga arvi]